MRNYKGIDIVEIVNNEEWQNLRRSFLGTWKTNSYNNVIKLYEYLKDFNDELKLVRVYNYLTGTAFRIGAINSDEIIELKRKVVEKLEEFKK